MQGCVILCSHRIACDMETILAGQEDDSCPIMQEKETGQGQSGKSVTRHCSSCHDGILASSGGGVLTGYRMVSAARTARTGLHLLV